MARYRGRHSVNADSSTHNVVSGYRTPVPPPPAVYRLQNASSPSSRSVQVTERQLPPPPVVYRLQNASSPPSRSVQAAAKG